MPAVSADLGLLPDTDVVRPRIWIGSTAVAQTQWRDEARQPDYVTDPVTFDWRSPDNIIVSRPGAPVPGAPGAFRCRYQPPTRGLWAVRARKGNDAPILGWKVFEVTAEPAGGPVPQQSLWLASPDTAVVSLEGVHLAGATIGDFPAAEPDEDGLLPDGLTIPGVDRSDPAEPRSVRVTVPAFQAKFSAGAAQAASEVLDGSLAPIIRLDRDPLPSDGATGVTTPDGLIQPRVSSIWVNRTTYVQWLCLDPTPGAAIWMPLGGHNGMGLLPGRAYPIADTSVATAARVAAADTLYITPFTLTQRVLLESLRLFIQNTAGAACSARLAIYRAGRHGEAGQARPVGAPVAATGDIDTTGTLREAKGAAIGALYPGAYYFAQVHRGTTLPALTSIPGTEYGVMRQVGRVVLNGSLAPTGLSRPLIYTGAAADAAIFPTLAGTETWDDVIGSSGIGLGFVGITG